MAVSVTLVLYALAVALGALRLLRGPPAQDRVLALDFMSSIGLLIVLVLGDPLREQMYSKPRC